MPLSNADKQVRFRKKQELKRFKNRMIEKFRLNMPFHPHLKNQAEFFLAQVETAADLPSGWSEEDLKQAEQNINQLYHEFISPRDDLMTDVMNGARRKIEEFVTAYDPQKPFSDIEKSISKTRALASHLISALELSALSNSEQAAAIMETVRHVGRATASSADIAKSEAILVCLTSLPSHYDRPDWFLDSLAKWLANRLGKKLVRELGKRLADY
jgi:hypothetical protein